jgi:hypothetical protein
MKKIIIIIMSSDQRKKNVMFSWYHKYDLRLKSYNRLWQWMKLFVNVEREREQQMNRKAGSSEPVSWNVS